MVFFVVDFFDDVIEIVEWIVGDVDYLVWFEQYFWMWFFDIFLNVVQDGFGFGIGDWQWMIGGVVDEVYDVWGFFDQMLVFVVDVWNIGFFVGFDLDQYVIWEEFVFGMVFLVGVYFDYFFGWDQDVVEVFFYVVMDDVIVQSLCY